MGLRGFLILQLETNCMRRNRIAFICLLIISLFWPGLQLKAQQSDSVPRVITDSLVIYYSDSGNNVGGDTAVSSLLIKLELLDQTLNKANSLLKRGFDTSSINEELPYYEDLAKLVFDNLTNDHNRYNLRNLYATRVLLVQMRRKVKAWQTDLIRYSKVVASTSMEIRNMAQDSVLKSMPSDSTLLNLYFHQISEVAKKWSKADTMQRQAIKKIGILQNRVARLYFEINDLTDEVAYRISSYNKLIFAKEEPPLWEAGLKDYPNSFMAAFWPSFDRIIYLLSFYYGLTWEARFLNFFIAMGFLVWVVILRRYVTKNENVEVLSPLQFIDNRALLSAVLLYFTIGPFLYLTPPAIYVELLWLGMILIVTILLWKRFPQAFRKYWIGIIILFTLFGMDNLLDQTSLEERWALAILNIAAIWLGWKLVFATRAFKSQLPKYTVELAHLFWVINALALLLNIIGRFTIAKFLSNSSVLGFALFMSLQVLVDVVLEALYLQMEAQKHMRIVPFVDFGEVKAKFKGILTFGAIILWAMAIAWSLNIYNPILEWLDEALEKERTVGSFVFTLASILIFIVVLAISFLLARLLTFTFGADSSQFAGNRKSKAGSWILLLRLVVLMGGFLLAIGAAGIPTDKLAIIIGALGVGIGFGLQNVVNNLVSGVILAFEKPMQTGDVIELGTRIGTVKEIGIRSSKITTYDGSVIIVPNGDFISQQLINWTHSNSYRRIELIVGVSYGTDLEKAKQLIDNVLKETEGVMSHPPAAILVHDFAESAVLFRILFWTNNYDSWTTLKSSVLSAVYKEFADNSITIPFPQRDIYIRSMPGRSGEI